MFLGLSSRPGLALAGDHHVADTEIVEGVIDPLLPVAAVCGDGPRRSAGPLLDSLDRGLQLGSVGGVAGLDGVVQDDAVVVVGDLGLVTELDRLPEPALGDRPGVGVVQADPPGAPGGVIPATR